MKRVCRVLRFLSTTVAEKTTVLFDGSSQLNERITVTQLGTSTRTLRFGPIDLGECQSVVDIHQHHVLQLPYVRALAAASQMYRGGLNDKEVRVLFLGLGGGSLPSWMSKTNSSVDIDVVEIDPVVVEYVRLFMVI
jgi:hypothetical protein